MRASSHENNRRPSKSSHQDRIFKIRRRSVAHIKSNTSNHTPTHASGLTNLRVLRLCISLLGNIVLHGDVNVDTRLGLGRVPLKVSSPRVRQQGARSGVPVQAGRPAGQRPGQALRRGGRPVLDVEDDDAVVVELHGGQGLVADDALDGAAQPGQKGRPEQEGVNNYNLEYWRAVRKSRRRIFIEKVFNYAFLMSRFHFHCRFT